MNKSITARLMSLLSRRELKEKLSKVALVLSCIAVFCITYILVAPVLTEEWPAVCGLEEHTHDDSCYEERLVQPEPELICGMEETGHVHTDACYEMHRGDLVCTETGTEEEPHVHDDSCYAWSYELTCTLSEEGHIHDESCYAAAAEPYTELVLTCGLEEHTHSDLCFDMSEAENGPDYICGFSTEHTHTEECYFEDGSLKCTIAEHIHTEDCVAVELPELDENEELIPIDEQFTYENEEVTVTFTVQGEIPVAVAETEESEVAETEAETEPVETAEPVLELVVTESEDQEAYNEYEELATEDGDVMLMQVLDYSLTAGGAEVDLSRCEVTTQVTPKPELKQMMDSPMPLMTYAAEDMENESSETEMFMELTTYSQSNDSMAYAVLAEEDPAFTVQYYAWLERAVLNKGVPDSNANAKKQGELSLGGEILIIDTDGGSTADEKKEGNLPYNKADGENQSPNDNFLTSLQIGENNPGDKTSIVTGKIKTATNLTEIYKSEELTYKRAPGLMYFNIVNNNANSEYSLSEIWVLEPVEGETEEEKAARASDINEADWKVYTYSSNIRFTNRPQTAAANDDYILIDANAVIRLVYDTKSSTENMPVNFYDYDISDGFIYKNTTDFSEANRTATSKQNNTDTWYANANNQGINKSTNYTGSGAMFGFGQGIASNIASARWNGYIFNQANSNNFMKATYKLVTGMDSNGHIQYDGGISAPKLFNEPNLNETPVTGKTSYDNGEYSLGFSRVGDTYTLTAVNKKDGTVAVGDLDTFTGKYFGASKWAPEKRIYTNNFWPMDSASSWGADGHDLKFGSTQLANQRKYATSTLPTSDDGKDHNPYFGMQYAVTFDLTSNYIGPLEYYFFGDDDMWVFLSEYDKDTKTYSNSKLVCDIGGVHASIGEYVNLWDYIDRSQLLENGEPKKEYKLDAEGNRIPLLDKNGNQIIVDGEPQYEMTDTVKTYALSFFYTERGASGSTCWMQFTLPTVVGVDLDSFLDGKLDDETGAVSIEKRLDGIENNEWFEFTIENLKDNFKPQYMLRDANGTLIDNEEAMENNGYILGGTDNRFKIRAGDVLSLTGIPKGTELIITEIGQYHEDGSGTSLDGYQSTVTVDGVQQAAPRVTVTVAANQRIKVVYTNIASYELPATGGSGTVLWYTIGGMLVLTGLCLMVYNNKQKRGRAAN